MVTAYIIATLQGGKPCNSGSLTSVVKLESILPLDSVTYISAYRIPS